MGAFCPEARPLEFKGLARDNAGMGAEEGLLKCPDAKLDREALV